MSNLIKTARTSLEMSQPAFGAWLTSIVGTAPINKDTVSRWESGRIAPSARIRCAVSYVAARELVKQTRHMKPDEAAKIIQEALR